MIDRSASSTALELTYLGPAGHADFAIMASEQTQARDRQTCPGPSDLDNPTRRTEAGHLHIAAWYSTARCGQPANGLFCGRVQNKREHESCTSRVAVQGGHRKEYGVGCLSLNGSQLPGIASNINFLGKSSTAQRRATQCCPMNSILKRSILFID
ncbi:hypothetical protein PHSY_004903 [Pseudozyma hubeiensis SY62]|uniref:Uncharacterized protein n=1 Tax=Pseudozyma hubeiensis (strain SY62) TaxID=1305764 RepID=R9P7G9_PSEHS|nr:hypothetical protein PHSY_004903 [Pseudozyma hubeiensis SY62]GAC97318.1 hypothetical protein PHSY_004903 [Pseudozyma hubeiensis SY62]